VTGLPVQGLAAGFVVAIGVGLVGLALSTRLRPAHVRAPAASSRVTAGL
jgi:hypothetical protein